MLHIYHNLLKLILNFFLYLFAPVDGQRYNYGDFKNKFCIQSCTKPITYLIGLEKFSEDYVHNFIGREPSGRNFNELCFRSR